MGSRGAQRSFNRSRTAIRTFQYLGSRGAQHFAIYNRILSDAVSILGLARSPTSSFCCAAGLSYKFQYLGSRGAQRQHILTKCLQNLLFQYLGSRGAQLHIIIDQKMSKGFNTWAREEPNLSYRPVEFFPFTRFQYLGSRGAQQPLISSRPVKQQFQYLGSRGAQRRML